MRGPLSAETISNLIGLIYDCALDPERWPETLTQIHRAMDFAVASLSLLELSSGKVPLMVSVGLEPARLEAQRLYGAETIEIWGGMETMLAYPLDEPLVLSRIRDRSELETYRFYREWAVPQGIHDVMALWLARDRMAFGSLGFGRHKSNGEIGQLEIQAARLLLPHVQRAVAISRLLDIKSVAASTFESALNTFAVGVVLTDADLGIVHANAAAEAMFSAGEPIRAERGVLSLRPPAVEAALGAAVRQAAENESAMGRRGFGIPANDGGAPHVLHVLPLRHGELRPGLIPRAVAAIFVAPAASPLPAPIDALTALFDLTAAEARIFEQIAAGRTTGETAKALGVEITTVKTHLAHIFSKTGTGRQADLVALAAALALPVGV
jgi:DNA-binding CsgD family transcriptional regulator